MQRPWMTHRDRWPWSLARVTTVDGRRTSTASSASSVWRIVWSGSTDPLCGNRHDARCRRAASPACEELATLLLMASTDRRWQTVAMEAMPWGRRWRRCTAGQRSTRAMCLVTTWLVRWMDDQHTGTCSLHTSYCRGPEHHSAMTHCRTVMCTNCAH